MLRVLVIHLDSMLFFSSLISWLPCPYLDMFFGLVHIKCICKVYIIRQKTIPISQILYFIYRAGKTNALGFWKLSGEGIKSQHTWSQSKTKLMQQSSLYSCITIMWRPSNLILGCTYNTCELESYQGREH